MDHEDEIAGSEAGSSAGGRIVAPAEEIKTHFCKECGRSFGSGKALGGHMSSAHVQASKDYAFKNLKPKMKHKSGGSSAEQNACILCGKAFPSKKSLFGHMRCHPDREWRGMDPPEEHPGYECFWPNREACRGPTEAVENDLRWPVAVKRARCPLKTGTDDVVEAAYHLLRLVNKGKQINGGGNDVVEDGGPNKKQKKNTEDQAIDDDNVELRRKMELINYNGKGKEKMDDCGAAINDDSMMIELRRKVESNGKGKEKMDCEAVDYSMMNGKKPVLLEDDNQKQGEEAVNFLAYIEKSLEFERARAGWAAQSCPNYAEKFAAQPSKLSPNFNKNGVIIEGLSSKAARAPKVMSPNKGTKLAEKVSPNTGKKGAIERVKKTTEVSPQKGDLRSGSTSSPTSLEKFFCSNCNKCFPTHQALGGHGSSHNKVKVWIHNTNVDGMILKTDKKKNNKINNAEIIIKTTSVTDNAASPDTVNQQQVVQSGMAQAVVVHDHDESSHVCTVCGRGFASGKALGGHKRCHNSAATPDEEKGGTGEKTTVRDFDLNEEPALQED